MKHHHQYRECFLTYVISATGMSQCSTVAIALPGRPWTLAGIDQGKGNSCPFRQIWCWGGWDFSVRRWCCQGLQQKAIYNHHDQFTHGILRIYHMLMSIFWGHCWVEYVGFTISTRTLNNNPSTFNIHHIGRWKSFVHWGGTFPNKLGTTSHLAYDLHKQRWNPKPLMFNDAYTYIVHRRCLSCSSFGFWACVQVRWFYMLVFSSYLACSM